MSGILRRALPGAAFTLWSAAAWAHSPTPGVEGLFQGVFHPFSTPAQILLLLGAGLLIGLMPLTRAKALATVFCIAVLGGVALGWSGLIWIDTATYAVGALACALAALLPGRGVPVAFLLAALGGLCLGAQSVPDPGPMQAWITTLVGGVLGSCLGLVYIVAIVQVTRQRYSSPALGTGLRVAAAWAGAIALLMLALSFAPVAA